jgi:hypothetical protein
MRMYAYIQKQKGGVLALPTKNGVLLVKLGNMMLSSNY